MKPILALLVLAACNGPETDTDPGTDVDTDANTAVVCADETPEACLYLDGEHYPVVVSTGELTDPDRVGQPDRPIRFARYEPLGVPHPLPVVVVSHGGSSGVDDPLGVLEQWSARLADRGFYVVAIAHTPRSTSERQALCRALGASVDACINELKPLNYDRPRDFSLVVDRLEDLDDGTFDLDHMGYLGHSAGAGSAIVTAGATRALFDGATPDAHPDDRPIAFVGLSPQGIDDDGFAEGSWVGVDRPVLTATGLSDGDSEAIARGRRDAYDGMPAGDKYRLWLEHPAAKHGLFGGNAEACVGQHATLEECEEMASWIQSVVYAFLDAYLRDDADAAAWLATDDVVVAGGGVVEWDRK